MKRRGFFLSALVIALALRGSAAANDLPELLEKAVLLNVRPEDRLADPFPSETRTSLATAQDGDFIFSPIDGSAWIIEYTGPGGDIIVPAELTDGVDSYVVTTIFQMAFAGNHDLTGVVLPEGLTHIGDSAFLACGALRRVILPESLKSIHRAAFFYSGLTEIDIPEAVIYIGDYAFGVCPDLTRVTLPEGLLSIGEYVFSSCHSLVSISLPPGLMSIGVRAFDGCAGLTVYTPAEGYITDYLSSYGVPYEIRPR